ncbi:phosphotransferase [Geodermatophilus maliterrae]|uniref:Phosphotransferase n=1 Tax=Geodermatophilus maliterrae TaxID=3162531 RepID=A0ABV3XIX6_9ACTN
MHAARYVRSHHPLPVTLDVRVPHPRRYHLTLVDALLRCSLPAAGRFGAVRAAVARHGLAHLPLSVLLAFSPRREHPELDRLRDELGRGWRDLARHSNRIPAEPPDLALMVLRRSLGRLVFVFGEDPDPLLVCKIPEGDDPRVDAEAAVLEKVSTLDFVPRHLGHVGRARVQEALPGHPLALEPLSYDAVLAAGWSQQLAETAAMLERLGVVSRDDSDPTENLTAEAEGLLTPKTVTRVRSSLDRLRAARVSVTCHGDVSAQNLMVRDGRVSGLVDWELARRGLPGTDVLNLVQSDFEQRLGLVRWSTEEVLEAFSTAWDAAPLFVEGRRAAKVAAEAVGLDGDLFPDVEVAHFAGRLQDRVDRPTQFLGGPRMAAAMVERASAD